MIIAFTGHRPDKLGPYNRFYVDTGRDPLEEVLRALLPERIISGMAPGIDVMALRAGRKLNIPVTAAIPWIGHGVSPAWRDRLPVYIDLLEECDRHVVVCEGDDYKPWFFQKRNEWMVDNCDLLLAVWDGSSGGTANCVRYAERVGREVRYFQWDSGTFAPR